MLELSPTVLGILLLLLGAGLFAATLVALRITPRLQPAAKTPAPPPATKPNPAHNEAVLLVQSGGRVIYINQTAREWFNVWEEEPNLESLARRTRPSEAFLTLCAGEEQSRFSLNGRFVEGTSYYTPANLGEGLEQHSAILVTMRRPQLVIEGGSPLVSSAARAGDQPAGTPGGDLSPQALQTFTELSQAMAASLDLEATLRTILESVERLLPSDLLEITIWDQENQHLVPYRLVGLPGVDRGLEKTSERYRADSGYSGYLISSRQPLLVKDVSTYRQVRPMLDRQRYPFQSYLGMPLLIAGNLIGTIELASLTKENYNESDLEILRLLSGQAAIALNNALLYQQELQRSTELAGLANLAQTISVIRDPQDLYTRLVESIAPLIQVEILGFLVYDENRRILHGQIPILGIQSSVVEWYQTTIEPDSKAEQTLYSAQPIVTEEAIEDPRLITLELHNFAQAASIHHAVFLPLASGGRTLGYLLAATKRDGSAFDQNDLRFLSIIAGQAAPIIDNATLVQQARHRAQRAETLRRIASLTSSAATLEEILKYSILDLGRLLQADIAAIFMLDENRGELRLHRESVFGIAPEMAAHLPGIPSDSPEFKLTITASQQQFLAGDLLEDMEAPPVLRPLVDELHIRSAIDVPLIARERGIGELIVGSLRSDFFLRGDVQTVATSAGQLAAAMEQTALSSQTDESLRERVEQMTTLTRLGRELNNTLDVQTLLQRVYEEALRVTHADCGSILLFELHDPGETQETGATPAGNQEPKVLLRLGDKPGEKLLTTDLHSLEKTVLEQGASLIIQDFKSAWTGYLPSHSGIRSALLIPIAYQSRVAGLIHLHAKNPEHFGEAERNIGEALAIQAAIAIGNALRYQEELRRGEQLEQRLETFLRIIEVSKELQTELPLEHTLETIANAIQASTPFETVLISLYDEQENRLNRVAGAGIPARSMGELRAHPQPWSGIQNLLDPKFQIGKSYFIPHEQSSFVPPEVNTYTALSGNGQSGEANNWHPDDILFLPLYNSSGNPLGLISVDAPRNNLRPDRPTIETLEVFSNQASLVIESQLKVHGLESQLNTIHDDLELAQQTAERAQSHLPVLLHKDLEQSVAIQNLSQRARRIDAGLNIASLISTQPTQSALLHSLGQEILARMEFDLVLVAVPTPGGLSLVHTFGAIPPEVNPTALLGQRNPLRQCLQTGEIMLVSSLNENEEWHNTPLLRALDTRSFVCLPVLDSPERLSASRLTSASETGQPATAAILAISKTAVTAFTADDDRLFRLLTRQVAAAMHNLALIETTSNRLNEIDLLLKFSQQLGSLDPASILNSLVESALNAVPMAQSAMVALWDSKQGRLIPQAAMGYTDPTQLMEVHYRPGEGVPGQVLENKQAVNLETVDFATHYNLTPDNLLHYRNATGGDLPVACLAVPVMAGAITLDKAADKAARTAWPLGVLVLDNAYITGAFTENDLAIVATLVQQTALTLENARLYQSAQQRSSQLQALTGASTNITTSLQKEALIDSLLDQLQTILPYDTGTLWLRQKEPATRLGQSGPDRMLIQAARGFADSDERIGLIIDVQDSQLIEEMIQTGKPIWVPDISQDPRFKTLSLEGELAAALEAEMPAPATGYERLSWLGVPMISSGQVTGVIALEKTEPDFYNEDDIQVASTFAAQSAVGLENAELYQESVRRALELDQRSQTLSTLNRLSNELSGSLDANLILSYTVQEFLQLVPCTSASALLFAEQEGLHDISLPAFSDEIETIPGVFTLQAEYPLPKSGKVPFPIGSLIPDTPIFDRLKETLGIFNTSDISQESELKPLEKYLAYHHTRSLLVVPIASGRADSGEAGARHRFHGLLLVHNDQTYHLKPEEVELARTISNQVAIALQNAGLFEETRSLTETLEMRVQQRTIDLERERQRSDTLLRIITELSASLDLDQVLHRTLGVLGEYVDADQIAILIARPGEEQLQRLASVGRRLKTSSAASEGSLELEQRLAGWIVTQRQSILVDNIWNDERWSQLAAGLENSPFYHSALGVPLMSGAEALGCLLLLQADVGRFSLDQLDLVQAAANQVSVSVNNAELYRLIRDQAEDLGTLLRTQQIENSRSKAILEAVADGVLVTDANRQITLFNESSEKILGLERKQVLGKSMEHFAGIFGRATLSWLARVNAWSHDPASYQPGDTYSEQITLEDGRVISVHLAPVTLRNDFLGTVSIFQDITHQVEVDRLKSEFVATVSHELRTPMTSIKGYVEILLMGAAGKLNDQQDRFLQVVKSNTERLTVLVNDLLDISQIESGKVTLSLQRADIEEIADQAIADLQRRIQGSEKSVSIEKEVQPKISDVWGDPERIYRIFDNLLDNAYQYNMPDGRILVRLHQIGDEVQIDIQDSGLGINPADKERVFERFFRGQSPLVMGVAGTGLGLSIVSNLVQMQNGRIWVESTGIPGEGSTFSFTLPVYNPELE
jgi:PAS domain S-box-containing protein